MLFVVQTDVDIIEHKGIIVRTMGIIKLWETVDTVKKQKFLPFLIFI